MFKVRTKQSDFFSKQPPSSYSISLPLSPLSHQRNTPTLLNSPIFNSKKTDISSTPKISIKRSKLLPRQTDRMTIYTCKDKSEKHFSQKVRNALNDEPELQKELTQLFTKTPQGDKWKPNGYLYYEFLLKHPLMIQSVAYSNLNKFKGKLPPLLRTKRSMTKSNIFAHNNDESHLSKSHSLASYDVDNNNNNKDNEQHHQQQQQSQTLNVNKCNNPSTQFTDSDVFNLKNDAHLLHRSGETYLFKQHTPLHKSQSFSNTTESKSDWIPKQLNRITFMNHTSVKYNVISPLHKSNSLTKNDIQKTTDNFYKINSVSEFVDLTHVSAPNLNKQYRQTLHNSKQPFAKENNIGANYQDMHHTYRDLFTKSFWK